MAFQYERLNLFCVICGMLDHTEIYCDSAFENDTGERKKDGAGLKVSEWDGRPMVGDQ